MPLSQDLARPEMKAPNYSWGRDRGRANYGGKELQQGKMEAADERIVVPAFLWATDRARRRRLYTSSKTTPSSWPISLKCDCEWQVVGSDAANHGRATPSRGALYPSHHQRVNQDPVVPFARKPGRRCRLEQVLTLCACRRRSEDGHVRRALLDSSRRALFGVATAGWEGNLCRPPLVG